MSNSNNSKTQATPTDKSASVITPPQLLTLIDDLDNQSIPVPPSTDELTQLPLSPTTIKIK